MNVLTSKTLYHAQLGLTDKVRTIKSLLSIGHKDALHLNYNMQSMFQDAWRGLEPEATPSPLLHNNKRPFILLVKCNE